MDSEQNFRVIRVEDTNSEALQQKLSAIQRGYFKDEFAEVFVKPSHGRKDVLMHRGYWCRWHIFNRIVKSFIQAIPTKKQIISLGCGYDTLPFQIQKEFPTNELKYIEIDLPQVAHQKVKKINLSKVIKSLYVNQPLSIDTSYTSIKSDRYVLFGQDLSKVNELINNFETYGIDPTLPTLIFAECVLTYIDSNSTSELLKCLTSTFKILSFVNYEMFNGNDQFGRMMVKNFANRGCPLIGIDAFPSLSAHQNRLLQLGFVTTDIDDMKTLYKQGTNEEERLRIEKIEFLDEWEEWNIMQSHYFVSLSHNFTGEKSPLEKNIQDKVILKLN